MGDTVLVVGGGGREHALAWSLAQSPQVDEVLLAPGNAGTAVEPGCRNLDVKATDIEGVVAAAREHEVRLVVVGPEDPLVDGLVDACEAAGIPAFGPSAAAAQLEGSKSHCKAFLLEHGIPTGAAETFTDAEAALAHLDTLDAVPVIKASGLAAGKGVIVAESKQEATDAIHDILVDGRFGTEVSVLAFCDGTDFSVMPAAQDHKRLLDGDEGPNTGGMGAFHPSPIADDALLADVGREVIAPTLAVLAAEGRPYKGVLYAGMMLTANGPKVIEFNCRFGDPETQVVLPLLTSDLLDAFEACVTGTLAANQPTWADAAAVTVVMASAGYPVSSAAPAAIAGLAEAATLGTTVFHAGTTTVGDDILATGGRVLAVTAVRPTLSEAAEAAHTGVDAITFEGAQRRTDIARATAEVRA